MSDFEKANLFGLPSESQRWAILIVLFLLFAIPVTLVATLQARAPGSQALVCYDLDGDGVVRTADLNFLEERIQSAAYLREGDFNNDSSLTQEDLNTLRANLGASCVPVVTFYATPKSVPAGGQVTLSWSVDYAKSVSIEGMGTVSSSGSREVIINSPTTFNLRAKSPSGEVRATTSVSVSR